MPGQRKRLALGDRIRIAREARGITQKALARRLDVEQGHVWKWEHGVRTPRMLRLIIIADMLDVSLDYLIRGIEEGSGLEGQLKSSNAKA